MPRTELPLRLWRRLVALTVFDISPAMVAAADARFRRAGITARVIRAGVGALPFADASFDLVIAAHVFEHLPEPVAALGEMRRVLRLGGWVVTCMARQSWLGAKIQAKWLTHRVTPQRAAGWLSAAGLDGAALDEPPRGLLRLTSLTAIGYDASAGTVGKELNT